MLIEPKNIFTATSRLVFHQTLGTVIYPSSHIRLAIEGSSALLVVRSLTLALTQAQLCSSEPFT